MISGIVSRSIKQLMRLVGVIVALPVAVIVILIGPIFRLRVGYFSADRIGHFVFDLEYYLSIKRLQPKRNRVVDIFYFKGEKYFREIESKIVLKILEKRNVVISLGGGSILKKETRDVQKLNRSGDRVTMDMNRSGVRATA